MQQQLGAPGFTLGSVDGEIGAKTRAAAAEHQKSNAELSVLPDFATETAPSWCSERASRHLELAGFAASATDGLLVDVAMVGRDAGSWSVKVPVSVVGEAENLCVLLNEGWIVRDQSGRAFPGSCFAVKPSMRSSERIGYEMMIENSPAN